jgi:hypothetical protein
MRRRTTRGTDVQSHGFRCGDHDVSTTPCARVLDLEARVTGLEERERTLLAVLELAAELVGSDTLLARLLRVPATGELAVDGEE